MAVFTEVSRSELSRWLADYPVGELLHFEGIASGIENTNYFVDTSAGRWVLTVFERLGPDKLPFHLGLMRHLADQGIACPRPVADRSGALSSMLLGRPAALVSRLPGRSIDQPDLRQCAQVGSVLASMHQACLSFGLHQPNPRGLDWCALTAPQVMRFLTPEQADLLHDELRAQQAFAQQPRASHLPGGAVHADLFRDNALFEEAELGGVIDFYFAGTDHFVYDLAVTCNDWCIDLNDGRLQADRVDSLLSAYRAVRPLLAVECEAWPIMLRRAAVRFWLSRLADLHLPRPASLLTPKDPAHFERIVRDRRQSTPTLAH